jgi:hypothetical protein
MDIIQKQRCYLDILPRLESRLEEPMNANWSLQECPIGQKLSVSYLSEAKPVNEQDRTRSEARVVLSNNQLFLEFVKESLGGDCDWILPFNLEADESDTTGKVVVAMQVPHAGRWIGVYAISAERARFHSRPDSTAVQKAFVVHGDIVYVYDEQPGWYFVEYEGGKKKTRGWIRKSDTLQP